MLYYPENAPVSSQNVELLNKLSNNEIEIHPVDTIPRNCKIPQCQITAIAQSQSQSKTSGLAKIIELKISVKKMLTVNGDIKDQLINDLMRIAKHFEMIEKVVYTIFAGFFDVDSSRNLILTKRFAIQNNWLPIKKCHTSIFIGNPSGLPSIKRTQYATKLSWACTKHNV